MQHVHVPASVLTDYARNLIRFKARQLCQRRDFHSAERKDLEQDLWLALVKADTQFDPTKASLDTFTDRVVNTTVAELLRARQRRKRGNGRHICSLDHLHTLGTDNPEPLSTTVSADDLARRTGIAPHDEAARCEDAEAVAHALAQMPVEVRDLCRRLMGGTTISSLARDLGVSRHQVRRMAASAKPFLEQSGFISETPGQAMFGRHT
jgi:RNA polymerase sigma-70 factor, ECF subfamily